MQIYLITHAHTEQSQNVAVDKWVLSQRGVEQAKKLADAPFWEVVDRVVVSSEEKCFLTIAEIIRTRRLPVWIDSRFDELRRSGWIENYAAQVAAVFSEPARSIAGWESVDAVRIRALSGLADLPHRFPGETVALVGHGLCLSILRSAALHSQRVDFSAWQRLSFATFASIEVNPLTILRDFEFGPESVR